MSPTPPAPTRRERERMRHVAELRQSGLASIPELIAELIAPTWAVRRAVVAALAEADPAAMPVLCDALRSLRTNEAQIAGLVDALSATSNDVDDLVLQLASDENVAVLCDATQVLGRRESARAVPKLKALTQHTDDNVALGAVEALGRIGGRDALDSLLALARESQLFPHLPDPGYPGALGGFTRTVHAVSPG